MDEQVQLKQAVAFFKSEQVYTKLFPLFRKKYESLGRIGGTVPTAPFNDKELEQIAAFYGVPVSQLQRKGSLSLKRFEEQLGLTKFHSIHLHALLEAYFGEAILSKKEQQAEKAAFFEAFLMELKDIYPQISFWLNRLLEKKADTRWIIQLIEKDKDVFREWASVLTFVFSNLPVEAERLPMFSQRITGDPHAFDVQTNLGRLLLHLLAVHQAVKLQETPIIASTTEEINKLLGDFHIYRDDLLNFVTCANLIAETGKAVHPVWEAAASAQTVQIVPLRELLGLSKVMPANGDGKVFIVENSGVCATLLDKAPDAPMVCTNGQFTLASWTLLEKLVEAGTMLYYAGDFDPEGLQIADRLKTRFGTSIELWHMNVDAYKKSLSNKGLSEERLEKLNSIADLQLIEIAEEMRQHGKAGYQEAVVESMVEDLNRM